MTYNFIIRNIKHVYKKPTLFWTFLSTVHSNPESSLGIDYKWA